MKDVKYKRLGPPSIWRRFRASPEDLFDFARDRVDLGHPVDAAQDAALAIVRQDRRRLTMIDLEPLLDGLWPVVRATGELAAAAGVANAVNLRPVVAFVITGTALLTGKPSGQTFNQGGLADLDLDHMVEPETPLGQHLIERLRLWQRPREAVKNEAVAAIRLADPIGDHGDDDAVGNQMAGIHDALDTKPELAA